MAALTKQEKQIDHLKARLGMARFNQILLLEQIIALKAELAKLKETHTNGNRPAKLAEPA